MKKFLQTVYFDIFLVISIFIVWRILLFILSINADFFLTYAPSFPYVNTILQLTGLPRWLYSWANFDGVHYIRIASSGYGKTALIQAFFPFYPILLRTVRDLTGLGYLTSGMIISNGLALGTFISFFLYVKQRFNRQLAYKALITFLLFPTSYYLVGVYTESLFLFAAVTAFLFARNKLWLWSAVMIGIASATRVVGIFLIPALAIDLFFQRYQITRESTIVTVLDKVVTLLRDEWYNVVLILLGSLGLLGYMYFLWRNFQDPLYFFHVQSEFGAGRQETVILLPQVILRYLKILTELNSHSWKYYSYLQEFVLVCGGIVLLSVAAIQRKFKIKISEVVFCILAFLLPTMTGTFSSMPRYILVCFPLFFLIPQLINKKVLFTLWLAISAIFLFTNTILFIQGYWVA